MVMVPQNLTTGNRLANDEAHAGGPAIRVTVALCRLADESTQETATRSPG